MFFVSLPTKEGLVLGLMAINHQDLRDMLDGQTVKAVDMRVNFDIGMPIPSVLQIVVGQTDEDLWEIVNGAMPESDGNFISFDGEGA